MLRSAQICKNCTISGNLRTITQMTLFFSSTFWALFVIFIFAFEKCQNLFSWDPPFGPFWFVKYLNFEGESCEIQETYTLRKVKNQERTSKELSQSNWDRNLSDLMVYKNRYLGRFCDLSLFIEQRFQFIYEKNLIKLFRWFILLKSLEKRKHMKHSVSTVHKCSAIANC